MTGDSFWNISSIILTWSKGILVILVGNILNWKFKMEFLN
jgi:hypothetical protein